MFGPSLLARSYAKFFKILLFGPKLGPNLLFQVNTLKLLPNFFSADNRASCTTTG